MNSQPENQRPVNWVYANIICDDRIYWIIWLQMFFWLQNLSTSGLSIRDVPSSSPSSSFENRSVGFCASQFQEGRLRVTGLQRSLVLGEPLQPQQPAGKLRAAMGREAEKQATTSATPRLVPKNNWLYKYNWLMVWRDKWLQLELSPKTMSWVELFLCSYVRRVSHQRCWLSRSQRPWGLHFSKHGQGQCKTTPCACRETTQQLAKICTTCAEKMAYKKWKSSPCRRRQPSKFTSQCFDGSGFSWAQPILQQLVERLVDFLSTQSPWCRLGFRAFIELYNVGSKIINPPALICFLGGVRFAIVKLQVPTLPQGFWNAFNHNSKPFNHNLGSSWKLFAAVTIACLLLHVLCHLGPPCNLNFKGWAKKCIARAERCWESLKIICCYCKRVLLCTWQRNIGCKKTLGWLIWQRKILVDSQGFRQPKQHYVLCFATSCPFQTCMFSFFPTQPFLFEC